MTLNIIINVWSDFKSEKKEKESTHEQYVWPAFVHLGDEVIPNAELWRDKSFFEDRCSFLLHYRVVLGTVRGLPLCSVLLSGPTAWWQKPESSGLPVWAARRDCGIKRKLTLKCAICIRLSSQPHPFTHTDRFIDNDDNVSFKYSNVL